MQQKIRRSHSSEPPPKIWEHPLVQYYGAILRRFMALFGRGLWAVHQRSSWQITCLTALITTAFLLWYYYILSHMEEGLTFFLLPSTYVKFNVISLPSDLPGTKLTSWWNSFMLLSGLGLDPQERSVMADYNFLTHLLQHPSLWIGCLIVFMTISAYSNYSFREGTGRVKPSETSALQKFSIPLKGILYLTIYCIPFWLITGFLIFKVARFTDAFSQLFIFSVAFILGLNRVSLNELVYINSLDLKIATGNKFLKKLIEAFTRQDLITMFIMEYGIKLQCLIILALIFSFGLMATFIFSKCVGSLWALAGINFVLIWLATAINGACNYVWGTFYAHYWNYDFKDKDVKYTPVATRLFKPKRWAHDEISPVVVLKKGNIAPAPSPVEEMAKKLQQKNNPPQDGDPAMMPPENSAAVPPAAPASPSWSETAKEIDMPAIPPPPPPRTPPKKKEEGSLPKIKFKW